jgi:uncharacterized membrane protein YkoI
VDGRRCGWIVAVVLSLGLSTVVPTAELRAEPRDLIEKLIKKKARKAGGEKLGVQAEPAAEQAGALASGMSLDEAVKAVRRRHPRAEVVGAQTRSTDSGRLVHEVKILKQNGQVKTYRFDATTGDNLD